ncbi:MAG: aldo/keto reductase [Clostridia bacterium]|nr:aldo/keto reductase [Clostridia bacterium]
MKTIDIGKQGLYGSELILGCMRINALNVDEADHLIMNAYNAGINMFDHSDVYGGGRCEELFGEVLLNHKELRDKIIIQSKCGIAKNADGKITHFDFSKEHILKSVDASLSRLKVDYLDTLLLHRPDTLMEPEEVADAFDTLYTSGKVKHFGVSNQNVRQIELLKTCVRQPLSINQMQMSITECGMIAQGLNTNMTNKLSYMHEDGVLEYSRINNMTLQAWSPFQIGFFEGTFIDNPAFEELNNCLQKHAERFGVAKTAVAVAWILRHPAKMQVIVGTTYYRHLNEILGFEKVELSREDWYEIYRSAGHTLP